MTKPLTNGCRVQVCGASPYSGMYGTVASLDGYGSAIVETEDGITLFISTSMLHEVAS